jgi:hypothetical protein
VGLHIAAVGATLVPVLIAYPVPLPDRCSGTCPSSEATDGRFRLELVLPRLAWSADDAITGMALLSYDGDAATTLYGSDGGLIAFNFDEVGGVRQADYAMTADCGPHPVEPATPLNVELFKSGAASGDGPNGDFLRSFFAGPSTEIRLPAGTWDVIAVADFADGASCSGRQRTMQTTLRITVSG